MTVEIMTGFLSYGRSMWLRRQLPSNVHRNDCVDAAWWSDPHGTLLMNAVQFWLAGLYFPLPLLYRLPSKSWCYPLRQVPGDVSHLFSPAVLDEQMPTDEIRQTRAGLQAIMSGNGPAWSELGAGEEIAELLKWSTVLKSHAHEAGYNVVQPDQFRRTVSTLDAKEDLRGSIIVMDGDVERALAGDPDFLGHVGTASGEGTTRGRVAYIVHAVCKSL